MSKILHGANMEINFYPHSKWLKGSDFHGYVCEICNSVWIYNLAQLLGKSWYQSDGRKEDSPLVINPLWSVSSFRNSSRISCSSFWSNAPISAWGEQSKYKITRNTWSIQPLPPPWWRSTTCWTQRSQSSHCHPCRPDMTVLPLSKTVLPVMFWMIKWMTPVLMFWMITIMSRETITTWRIKHLASPSVILPPTCAPPIGIGIQQLHLRRHFKIDNNFHSLSIQLAKSETFHHLL